MLYFILDQQQYDILDLIDRSKRFLVSYNTTFGMQKETIQLKVLIIGDSGVGKTRLLVRYVEDTFTNAFYSTIGVDFKMKQIYIGNKKIRMQIWDTAAQQKYRTVVSSIYKKTDAIMIVYDITDRQSFKALKGWQIQAQRNIDKDAVFLIVGNKTDRKAERQVSKQEVKEYVNTNKFLYMEVSALNNSHVKQAFELLASAVLGRMNSKLKEQHHPKKQKVNGIVNLNYNKSGDKNLCSC